MNAPHLSVTRAWPGEVAGSLYVGGLWRAGESTEVAVVEDPATETTVTRLRFASDAQVEAAIRSARAAFDEGPWRSATPEDRSRLLHRLVDLAEEHAEELTDLVVTEVGSPVTLARTAQVGAALDILRWFADAALRGPAPGGYTGSLDGAGLLRRQPAGVVAAVTAYNFPLYLLARKLGPALASGCTVVVLPSERAPLATHRFFELLHEVGFPPGVANLVVGSRSAGVLLSSHPDVDMVSFTGSVQVGSAVMAQAAPTTKKVVLELGGKSPTIVLPGADLDAVVGPTLQRMSLATGQACGCTTRTFVHRDQYDEYVDLAETYLAEHLAPGDPRRQDTALGPLIRAEQRSSVERYVDRALDEGASLVAGGGRPDLPRGWFMNVALLAGADNRSEIARTELFGPVGLLFPYTDLDEAVRLANDSPYGLNAGVWGAHDHALTVAQRLRTGTVAVNGGGPARPDAPWGGPGLSGVGREGGDEGFGEYFETQFVHWSVTG
jgi:aldehyde dehydrogenase (NAD+)